MSKKLKTYKVKVSYVFTGTVDVQAESKERAKFIVTYGFGGLDVSVGKSSWELNDDTDEGIKDWDLKQTDTIIT